MKTLHRLSGFLSGLPSSVAVGSGRAAVVVIEFATIIYLMRQLGPEPFGLVAMAMAIIVAFEVFSESGAGASLVSDRQLNKEGIGAAFIIAAGLGMLLMLVALICTPLVVSFYGDPRLEIIWIISCVIMGLSSLLTIPKSLALREQRFWLLSWGAAFAQFVAAIAAIALAQEQQDFWPIVLYHAMATAMRLVFFFIFVRLHMRRPAKEDLVRVFHFGRGLVGANLLSTASRYADKVVIGRVLGEQALGLYMLSYRVLMLPLREVGSLIGILAYPRLSNMAPDWSAVGRGLGAVMRDVALFATPFCIGMAVAAPELIMVVFGEAWMGALVPLQVLALLGIVQAPFEQSGMAYTVSRNTGEMFRWFLLSTPAIVLSFFAGLPWGISGVAIAYALTWIALLVPMLRIAASVLDFSPMFLAREGLIGIALGAVMSLPLLIVYVVAKLLEISPLMVLSFTIAAGALTELALYIYVVPRRRRISAAW